jgi:hypothetical protein
VKKNYHGYAEKKTGSVVQRDDYYINASFIRFPIGFGYRFINKPQAPYVKGGLVQYYKLKTSGNQLSEREAFGTVTTSEKEISFTAKNQRGVWVSIGFDKNLWKQYRLFVEVRYELTNGFIGQANRTESSTKNLSGILGIKF